MFCKNCSAEISDQAKSCPQCGHPSVEKGDRSKVAFVLLALLLGGFGIHRMYLGDWLLGIVYLLFCWTYIPAIIALVEAIVIGFRKDDLRFSD